MACSFQSSPITQRSTKPTDNVDSPIQCDVTSAAASKTIQKRNTHLLLLGLFNFYLLHQKTSGKSTRQKYTRHNFLPSWMFSIQRFLIFSRFWCKENRRNRPSRRLVECGEITWWLHFDSTDVTGTICSPLWLMYMWQWKAPSLSQVVWQWKKRSKTSWPDHLQLFVRRVLLACWSRVMISSFKRQLSSSSPACHFHPIENKTTRLFSATFFFCYFPFFFFWVDWTTSSSLSSFLLG